MKRCGLRVLERIRQLLRPNRGNVVIFVKNGKERVARRWFNRIHGLKISMTGQNCTVRLELPIDAVASKLVLHGWNTFVKIGSGALLKHANIVCEGGNRSSIAIGRNVHAYYALTITVANSSCRIGNNCMIASNVILRATDCHPVFYRKTGAIANFQKRHLEVGDHCWLCSCAILTKNAKIPNDTIVGSMAVVTREFSEEHTILAGNPATVVKTGVTWEESNDYFWRPEWVDGKPSPLPQKKLASKVGN
ncbi:MAG: hypothetical protein LBP65_03160 [Puniceicoccales bacterium]|nr:hypothetical protein [Puniceicoccales bacterium]